MAGGYRCLSGQKNRTALWLYADGGLGAVLSGGKYRLEAADRPDPAL